MTDLRVTYRRATIPLPPSVRGTLVPMGPRGLYVGLGPGGFRYAAKADDAAPPVAVMADAIPREIDARSRRTNFFKVYAWTVGIFLLFTLSEPTVTLTLFILVTVGAVPLWRWNRDRRLTRIFYDVNSEEVIGRIALVNLAGESLAHTARLWHGATVARTPIRCARQLPDSVDTNVELWCVALGPKQIFFLPDQLVVREGPRFWSIAYADLLVHHEVASCTEYGVVPPDARVVGRTWMHTRKDGGPDLRFSKNRELPVVAYGQLSLRASDGSGLLLQTSNPEAAQRAAMALRDLVHAAREAQAPMAPAYAPPPYPAPPPTPHPAPTYGRPAAMPAMAPAPTPTPPSAVRAVAAPNPFLQRDPALDPWANAARLEKRQEIDAALTKLRSQTVAVPQVAQRLPPPVPYFQPRLAPAPVSQRVDTRAHFVGPSETLTVAGRTIPNAFTYVAAGAAWNTDASTIVMSLPVGTGAQAMPMPYWPRYSEIDRDQRARYLDWMAAGRSDPTIPVGYAFIFFYGIERRVFIENADIEPARAEVARLLGIYGASNSFRLYASDFLAFTYLRSPELFLQMNSLELAENLVPLAASSTTALAAIAGWHHARQVPLPAEYAAMFVRTMEEAKRSAVVTQSPIELLDLFAIRYREAYGDGVLLEAAKRPLKIDYRAASATLANSAISVSLPDVFKKVGQFRKIISIWNQCIEDLRKASSKKRGAKQLDAASWTALPPDLRAQYDHPDQDRWDTAVAALPRLGNFHIGALGALATLVGIDKVERLTPALQKRIGARAADVGYAIEPEPRLRSKGVDWTSEVVIWRTSATDAPDARVHGSATAMLSLAMTVALADGVFTPEEDQVVSSFLGEMFKLDDGMRERIEALKQLVTRDPQRLGSVARKLREARTESELRKVAAVLVAIAAADGTIAVSEEKALKRLYKDLGLPLGDFSTTLARTGARLERDATVEVQAVVDGAPGVRIPPPPDQAKPGLQLNQAAIDAIVADTKDVAAILAEVFDGDAVEPESAPAPAVESSRGATIEAPPRASEATAKLAQALDVRYHAVLEQLLTKPVWTASEVRAIADRSRLMPGAILDTINGWSDEALGDFLIEDAGEWKVNQELVQVNS